MARLKTCRDCRQKVSKRARICPGCGAPLKQTSSGTGCLAFLFLIGGCVYLVNELQPPNNGGPRATSQPQPSATPDEPGTLDAWIMAQNFVEDRLKSPSTASYGGVFDGDYQRHEDVVTAEGNGKFRVKAWVDSENAFGAMIRTHFYCELQYAGDDKWKLLRFEVEE